MQSHPAQSHPAQARRAQDRVTQGRPEQDHLAQEHQAQDHRTQGHGPQDHRAQDDRVRPARPARLSRRRVVGLGLAAGAWLLLGGHVPYGQWGVYRKRYLLILTDREDPPSFELGGRIAAVLAKRLPESRARVSRAPHRERIASLISSKQMDVALMRRDDAAALRLGAPPFADYGPVPLHAIAGIGEYLLVCRDDFPARHAWLVADALSRGRGALPAVLSPAPAAAGWSDARVPLHPGARAYFAGGPQPDPEPGGGHDEDHAHEQVHEQDHEHDERAHDAHGQEHAHGPGTRP